MDSVDAVPVLSFRPPRRSSTPGVAGADASDDGNTRQAGSARRNASRDGQGRRRTGLNGAAGRGPADPSPARSAQAAPPPAFGAPARAGAAPRSAAPATRNLSVAPTPAERRAGSSAAARRRPATSFPDAFAPAPLQPFGGAPDPSSPRPAASPPSPQRSQPAGLAVFGTDGHLLAVNQERRELVCSLIGLAVKIGLVAVTGLSLVRIAGAYQHRMDSNGEIMAVLDLEKARLERARERFDALFMVEGEQRLIREQSQWIAPNRLRVIWQSAGASPRPQDRP